MTARYKTLSATRLAIWQLLDENFHGVVLKMRLILGLILYQLWTTFSADGFVLRPSVIQGQHWVLGRPAGRASSRRQVQAMSFVSTDANVDEITMVKNSLLQVAAMTERGQLATTDQRNDVNLLVDRLEALKMEGPEYKDDDMVGIWTLVYSSSQAFRSSPFFATFQALLGREKVAEKIFAFTDAFPNAKIGQARQIVNEDCTELVSRVEMSLWPHRWISGVVETRARIVNDDVGERLEVIVDDTSVRDSVLGKISPRLEGWRVPVDQLSERIFDRIPRITLETMFLDQDLRISRLPDRNFLVYVKDYRN